MGQAKILIRQSHLFDRRGSRQRAVIFQADCRENGRLFWPSCRLFGKQTGPLATDCYPPQDSPGACLPWLLDFRDFLRRPLTFVALVAVLNDYIVARSTAPTVSRQLSSAPANSAPLRAERSGRDRLLTELIRSMGKQVKGFIRLPFGDINMLENRHGGNRC